MYLLNMEPLLIALSSVSPVLAGFVVALRLKLGKVNKQVLEQREVIEKYTAEVNKAELVINNALKQLESQAVIPNLVEKEEYSQVASKLLAGFFKGAYQGKTMPNDGYVYIARLITNDRPPIDDLFKVGQTRKKEYSLRFKELKNKFNAEVEPVFVVKTNDVDRLEAQTLKLLIPYQATVDNSGFPPLGDECFIADYDLIKDALLTAAKANDINIEVVFE